ncbi:GTP-binding protein,putative [Plasmodium sp.]|nr:GTP-binding protein,putative [Plasmodium sp.]
MNNLFNDKPETNQWNNLFKKKDYNNINDDILLQEEDTYECEDYISGFKKSSKKNSKNSLYNYSFNINDKSRQLEDIHDQLKDNLIDTQKRKIKENEINGDLMNDKDVSSKNHFNKRNIKVDTLSKINKDESIDEEKKNIQKKKKYIGLKNKKKKNSWNYINAKYNKWIKKSNRKNISSEIPLSPIKKEDIMKRYVQKQETKYTKEKNKFLRQKKNLGMISKPPNHKNKKRISKNYSLSNEQKIFDREAFFKYRDVQK